MESSGSGTWVGWGALSSCWAAADAGKGATESVDGAAAGSDAADGSWAGAAADDDGAAEGAGTAVGLAELPQLTASRAIRATARYTDKKFRPLSFFMQLPHRFQIDFRMSLCRAFSLNNNKGYSE